MKRLVLLLLSLPLCAAAFAQDPDFARGFSAGLAYRTDGVDHTSLFNGTLTLNITLGQSYTVGGTLSYGLIASYATNQWQTEIHEYEDTNGIIRSNPYMIPSEHANAGLGWIVSMGEIVDSESGTNGIAYMSPDGSMHAFEWTLHPLGNEPVNTSVMYTRDGSYLRLIIAANSYELQFPNGHRHFFNGNGKLTSIQDPFGNSITVSYGTQVTGDPYPDSTVWTITDNSGTGRYHKVYFRPDWSYETLPWSSFPNTKEIVDKVSVAGFNGGRAEYQFNYLAVPGPGGTISGYETSRRCSSRHDSATSQYIITSLLTEIAMPEGPKYGMKYDRGNQSTCSYVDQGGASGNIVRLLLPSGSNIDATDATGGHIDWTYQAYTFPGTPRTGANNSAGVKTRKAKDGATVISETEYVLGKEPRPAGSTIGYDVWRRVITKEGGAALSSVRHWFTACRRNSVCGNEAEYGLPFTRLYESNGAYLSMESERANADGTFTALRKRYVRYEGDVKLYGFSAGSWNQRKVYERSDYEDGKFTDVTYSEFDGIGHYRKAVTNGNFESANVRTSFTDWNDTLGTYALNDDGTLKPGFSMPSTATPWRWMKFDKQWTQQDGVTSASEVCFDTLGFNTGRRTFTAYGESPARSTTDLLSIFTRDTRGNLTKEQYFGSERGGGAPTGHLCGQALTGETYRIDNTWLNGMRTKSRYMNADGTAMSFYLTDADFDGNTGLPVTVRALNNTALSTPDGVSRTYEYDLLGRVTEIEDRRVRTDFAYTVAPPSMTAREYDATTSALMRTTSDIYDSQGRLVKQTRSMPGGVTTTKQMKYDALGRLTEEYPFGVSLPTIYKYDELSRVTSIKQPGESDATAIQISYNGVTSVTRTAKVRTGGDQNTFTYTDSVSTEELDAMSRVIRVTEPAQTVGGTRPVSEYTYDLAGRLTSVCSNKVSGACGQQRSFTFDNRGFLKSETHPENGTTTYAEHDARGHLRRRYIGAATDPFHVGIVVDRAERVTQVHQADSAGSEIRKLKFFTYGTNNSGTDLRNGQVTEAIRFNWLSIGPYNYNVQVVENYTYDADGRVSTRKTADWICLDTAGNCYGLKAGDKAREFEQSFTYEALGHTETLGYPRCTLGCLGNLPDRTITNGYDNGLLTSVTWTGAVVTNALSYHQTGMIKEVRHDNFVYDKIALDPANPSRPLSLVTENALDPSTCVSPSFISQPQSKTVEANTSFTLTAQASGESGQSITYQWYRGIAGDRNTPIGSPITTTGVATMPAQSISSTTYYWVDARNNCSSAPGGTIAQSVTATITPCTVASISSGPADRTITRTQTTTLTVVAAGSAPLSYQWYKMASLTGTSKTAIQGATSASLDVTPSSTTRYRVYVTNACTTAEVYATVIVTVEDPPTAPGNVSASYESANNRNRIQWTASSSAVGIGGYTIERSDGASFNAASTATTYHDVYALVSGRTYVYRVRARDTNFVWSSQSAPELTTVFTFADDPIVAGGTFIRGIHVGQLRQAVDAVRTAAGLSPAWTSYTAPTGTVPATHFAEILTKLNEARLVLQVPDVVLTDVVLPLRVIYGRTVTELRNGTK